MSESLLQWQWGLYRAVHKDRRNLLIHIFTQPIFVLGALTAVTSPLIGGWRALVSGLVAMVVAMALQGRGHGIEKEPPVPFRSRADIFARIFAEQFITFPRFVLSGAFAEAWRQSKPQSS